MADTQVTPIAPSAALAPWYIPKMRDILATGATTIFAIAMFAPLFKIAIDQDLKGAAILQWGGVMQWYFGSAKSSAIKDETISTMATTASSTPQVKP